MNRGEQICWFVLTSLWLAVPLTWVAGLVAWGPIRLLSLGFTSFPFLLVIYALRRRKSALES